MWFQRKLPKTRNDTFALKKAFLGMGVKVVVAHCVFEKLCSAENTNFIVFSAKHSSCSKQDVCWKKTENSYKKNSGWLLTRQIGAFCLVFLLLVWFVVVGWLVLVWSFFLHFEVLMVLWLEFCVFGKVAHVRKCLFSPLFWGGVVYSCLLGFGRCWVRSLVLLFWLFLFLCVRFVFVVVCFVFVLLLLKCFWCCSFSFLGLVFYFFEILFVLFVLDCVCFCFLLCFFGFLLFFCYLCLLEWSKCFSSFVLFGLFCLCLLFVCLCCLFVLVSFCFLWKSLFLCISSGCLVWCWFNTCFACLFLVIPFCFLLFGICFRTFLCFSACCLVLVSNHKLKYYICCVLVALLFVFLWNFACLSFGHISQKPLQIGNSQNPKHEKYRKRTFWQEQLAQVCSQMVCCLFFGVSLNFSFLLKTL